MANDVIVEIPNLYYGANPTFTAKALASSLTGAWHFSKDTGETDAQAALRCAINRAPAGGAGAWIGGVPVFSSNHARFVNSKPLVTGVADVGASGGCYFMVARCQDTTVGATSADRATIGGNYAGNTNEGFGVEFAAYSTGTARALDSNFAGVVQPNQITTAANDLGKWRILYAQTRGPSPTDGEVAMKNLYPADGSFPNPTPSPLVSGRKIGIQTLAIGGRISDSSVNYTPTVHKDIAWFLSFNAIPTLGERNTIQAQLEAICTATGITLGA